MTACPPPPAVSWLLGLLLACACLWLLALALLTAAALRDRWRAWRRGPTAEPDDGGPEVDRLIAESAAAWRAEVAGRIVDRLECHGWIRRSATLSPEQAARLVGQLISEELERSPHAD